MTFLDQSGIELRDIRVPDEITLIVSIRRRQRKKLMKICQQKGLEAKITQRNGLYWHLSALLHRPVLLTGVLAMLLLGFYVPSRIFFVRVEGNTTLPTRLILETAAECGIRFGANRRAVRSEQMKNALLETMPQLQWAGINTQGCVAVITVKQRQDPTPSEGRGPVGSIIASRDGIIASVTATKGNAICKVGQAVKAGQILISGYTDCGISIKAEGAKGEIYAQTNRQLAVIYPTDRQQRVENSGSTKKYSLIIGKNRINLYFGSGISDGSCVKMYEENYMTLPGGYVLPIGLVTEHWTSYSCIETTTEDTQGICAIFARSYLTSQMVAGRILSESTEQNQMDNAVILTGQYACLEMIGQFRTEEIIKPNGAND